MPETVRDDLAAAAAEHGWNRYYNLSRSDTYRRGVGQSLELSWSAGILSAATLRTGSGVVAASASASESARLVSIAQGWFANVEPPS